MSDRPPPTWETVETLRDAVATLTAENAEDGATIADQRRKIGDLRAERDRLAELLDYIEQNASGGDVPESWPVWVSEQRAALAAEPREPLPEGMAKANREHGDTVPMWLPDRAPSWLADALVDQMDETARLLRRAAEPRED